MTVSAPAFLTPTSRFAGDDWTEANALTYVVYETPPVYAADGVTVVTAGVPQPLQGYMVTGTLRWQPRCGSAPIPSASASGSPLPVPVGAIVDPVNGIISLSLAAAQTAQFPRQPFALWSNPSAALLIVQPKIVDPNGNQTTVGLQQLFVF